MKFAYCFLFSALLLAAACRPTATPPPVTATPTSGHFDCCLHSHEPLDKDLELEMYGLVEVSTLDEGIMVQLVYCTPYNFMGKVLYRDMSRAYLQPDVADKLLAAYRALKKLRPDLTLIIYDAARPVSVQWDMWNMVKGTEWDYYVKNPEKGGGMHNFGAAVDLSLVDGTGQPLPMGTPFDYFGYEANTDKEAALVAAGRITPRELENRLLLRKIMTGAGFRTVKSEWWHFNACSLEEAQRKYRIIE
jgi:D-alanyl-D-alanine dipeptidase